MKHIYRLIQCTWGILQTLLGFFVFLINIKHEHFLYHGAIITKWNKGSSVSLGMFVFITKEPYFYRRYRDQYSKEELFERLLVHEYGHTIQSLILGPLYLIIMGIPSALWAGVPYFHKKRKNEKISYFAFFTEKWANTLGEKVTKTKSMENLLID